MKNKRQEYKAINCLDYDLLLSKTTLKQIVNLVYQDQNGNIKTINTLIKNIIIKDKAEFLLLPSNETIRLDYIKRVDNNQLNINDYCKS